MPCSRTNLQRLPQDWPHRQPLSTGYHRAPKCQTQPPKTSSPGPQTETHQSAQPGNKSLHFPRGWHTMRHFTISDKQTSDTNITTVDLPSSQPMETACKSLSRLIQQTFAVPYHPTNSPACLWAKLLPTESVILPYANPPIKPIGQATLTASNGSSTCYLTFQVIDMDQPALLSTEAGKHLAYLPMLDNQLSTASNISPWK